MSIDHFSAASEGWSASRASAAPDVAERYVVGRGRASGREYQRRARALLHAALREPLADAADELFAAVRCEPVARVAPRASEQGLGRRFGARLSRARELRHLGLEHLRAREPREPVGDAAALVDVAADSLAQYDDHLERVAGRHFSSFFLCANILRTSSRSSIVLTFGPSEGYFVGMTAIE